MYEMIKKLLVVLGSARKDGDTRRVFSHIFENIPIPTNQRPYLQEAGRKRLAQAHEHRWRRFLF